MTLYGEIPSQFGVAGKVTDSMLAVQSGKYGCPSHWRVADRSSVTPGAMYISPIPTNDHCGFEKWDPNILEKHMAIILESVTPLHGLQRSTRHGEFCPEPLPDEVCWGEGSLFPPRSPRRKGTTDEHQNTWRCASGR